jgi:hypothetical protein
MEELGKNWKESNKKPAKAAGRIQFMGMISGKI